MSLVTSAHFSAVSDILDCSQSRFLGKTVEIERLALRAAILHESQNYVPRGWGRIGFELLSPTKTSPRYI